jgi:hypothetical protein
LAHSMRGWKLLMKQELKKPERLMLELRKQDLKKLDLKKLANLNHEMKVSSRQEQTKLESRLEPKKQGHSMRGLMLLKRQELTMQELKKRGKMLVHL